MSGVPPVFALASEAVKKILDLQQPEPFFRWMREDATRSFPEIFGALPEGRPRRAIATTLAFSFWNATPLPRNGYRPATLPKPERNGPCLCGSGVKFKRCCGGAPAPPALDPEEMSSPPTAAPGTPPGSSFTAPAGTPRTTPPYPTSR